MRRVRASIIVMLAVAASWAAAHVLRRSHAAVGSPAETLAVWR
jgi:hypothetical protein